MGAPVLAQFRAACLGAWPDHQQVARTQWGRANPVRLVGDYTAPILKPLAAKIVKKQGEMELNGVAPRPRTINVGRKECLSSFSNYGMQMLQQPHQITILSPKIKSPPRAHERASSGASDTILVWGFRSPLRRRHAGDRHRGGQEQTGHSQCSICTAHHIVRLCMWWNVITLLISKQRRNRLHETQKRMSSLSSGLIPLDFDPDYGASTCNFSSPSKIRASFRCPGLRPLLMRARLVNGRNMPALKTRMNTTPERTLRCRERTSQISEI